MTDLHLEELSASTIVEVNNMELKPGQEQFLAPVSYGIAATVVNPASSWQRVALNGDTVVGFISANFDPDEANEDFRSVLWRINVDADAQGQGIGTFLIENLIEEARARGMEFLTVIYDSGDEGPESFFQFVGFTPRGENEYGEIVAEYRL